MMVIAPPSSIGLRENLRLIHPSFIGKSAVFPVNLPSSQSMVLLQTLLCIQCGAPQ